MASLLIEAAEFFPHPGAIGKMLKSGILRYNIQNGINQFVDSFCKASGSVGMNLEIVVHHVFEIRFLT